MKLTLIIDKNCPICNKTKIDLNNFLEDFSNIDFHVEEFTEQKTSIIPALFIEGRLYCYGEVDLEKFNKYIGSFRK